MAASVTLSCLLLGYPLAFVIARAEARTRTVLLALLMVPFLGSFIVRAYAVKIVLQPFALTDSALAVWTGMVTNYLPFMTLPIFASIERFDVALLEAAQDLGAGDWRAVTRVLLPLTRDGVVAGCLLVFVPTLGEFMIPDVLGGARTMLLGNLITEQFLKVRDWPFGAALVMALVAVIGVFGMARGRGQARGARRAERA